MIKDLDSYFEDKELRNLRAFCALLAYRINKRLHFERWYGGPGKSRGGVIRQNGQHPIPDGQKEEDFANMFGCHLHEIQEAEIVMAVHSHVDRSAAINAAKGDPHWQGNRKTVYQQREEMKGEIARLTAAVEIEGDRIDKMERAFKEMAAKEYRKYNVLISKDVAEDLISHYETNIDHLVESGFLDPVASGGEGLSFMMFSVIDAARKWHIDSLRIHPNR